MEAALTLEAGRTGEFDARLAESDGGSRPADMSTRSDVDISRVIADFRLAAIPASLTIPASVSARPSATLFPSNAGSIRAYSSRQPLQARASSTSTRPPKAR